MIIGITVDSQTNQSYSNYPWYALRQNYVDAIAEVGAIPILLPLNLSALPYYLTLLDGVVITGGDFDIDPKLYGEEIKSKTVSLNPARTNFELSLMKGMLEQNKPILGICGGMQLLNVVMGGTLIQDIQEQTKSDIHQQSTPKHLPHHNIIINQNTLLYDITQTTSYMVNSTHHQAVAKLGKNLSISAVAEDGIIEAIEHQNQHFCLGLQWHPEYCYSTQDKNIFKAMVEKIKSITSRS